MRKYLSKKPRQDLLVAFDFLIVLLLLLLSGFWAWNKYLSSAPYVDETRYPIRGIDISSHNGIIDFEKVKKSGVVFVYIKASEGTDFHDKYLEINYKKAKAAGLKIGFYHFFRFDKDGVEQALNFLKSIGARHPDIGLAVDIEKTGNAPVEQLDSINFRLSAMIDYLNLRGYRVTLYTNRDGYYDYLSESFPGYPLWICSFSRIPFHAEWTFWQYNHHGKVPGIKGDVDLDAFCGSEIEWRNFLNGSLWPYESQ